MSNLGIIGNGFVGNSLSKLFTKHTVLVFDILDSKCLHPFEQLVMCDVIFICLPTPTKNGKCDISLVIDTVLKLKKHLYKGVIIVKSTVVPGTTNSLKCIYPRILFNPEFLREKHAVFDTLHPDRILIGGEEPDSVILKDIYLEYFSKEILYIESDPTIFEMVKYMSNTFLATKVSVFNEFYNLAEKKNIEYNTLLNYLLLDKRINSSHTKVPGDDNKLGYGGNCFIKDTEAFIHYYSENKVECPILLAITNYAQNKIEK